MLRIGIDIGGTFTDFVVYNPANGQISSFKLLSDRANPAAAVLQGLASIPSDPNLQIVHGSTVATNALLERKGAKTALLTTRGFKDVLQIARQNRPEIYDWTVKPASPLVASNLRLEVDERVNFKGQVLLPLDLTQTESLIAILEQNKVESVAICLLFSFLHPQHERVIADLLRKKGYLVSSSSEILPEFREFERTSTTVVNAYVSPILNHYLGELETALPGSSIQIMQSNGGMISTREARQNGVRCVLSGPAGGIIGTQKITQAMLEINDNNAANKTIKLITFDMGGTSTDVSLIDGQPSLTTDANVGGCPIHVPMLDIHTIGAGGGSIAYVDAGGSLRVGPQSAGADPGPACYGRGEYPTVTDANLVLGRLLPDHFLGGKMKIYPSRAESALSVLGKRLDLSPTQAAYGVIEVVNAQMERALRVISVERGHDPRDFSLFSFGGAGGLHAVDLAGRMGIPKVIISKFASTLSALGMLSSNVVKDYVKTVMLQENLATNLIDELFFPMIAQGVDDVKAEGIHADRIDVLQSLDVRFSGQSYEINVPFSDHFIQDFHQAHRKIYGYTYEDKKVEVVNLRLRVIGKINPIDLQKIEKNGNSISRPMEYKSVELNGSRSELPVYDYDQLDPGSHISGPALIVSSDTTILAQPGDEIFVDCYLNLCIEVSQK
jgi:N-methylhydantoinase A